MALFQVTTASDVVSATDGLLSLREAAALANADADLDTIEFASALEGQTLTLTGGHLVLTQDVAIDGDRNDDGIEVRLAGLGLADPGQAAGSRRLLTLTGATTDVSLADLTLENGIAADENGGAVRLGGGSLVLTGVTLRDNVAQGGGSLGHGGAIFADAGSRLTLVGSTVAGNWSMYGGGGGIATSGNASVTIQGSRLTDNLAAHGGGLDMRGGTLLLETSLVGGNAASLADPAGEGGGIRLANATATIARSAIVTNEAAAGGGLDLNASRVNLAASTVADNLAESLDAATGGGGIAVDATSALSLRSVTVTDNLARTPGSGYTPPLAATGGGIWVAAGGQLDIANSILAGNAVRGGATADPDLAGTITATNGRNVFGSAVLGNAAGDREGVAGSLLFAATDAATGGGRLAQNGGPTPTVALRDAATNPALAAADPSTADAADQRGVARPAPAGTSPDLGAFELAQAGGGTPTPGIEGTEGDDTLIGTAAAETIRGLGGNDLIEGGAGNDLIDGGTGFDLVRYTGTAAVTLDLRGDLPGDADTAVQGRASDTLVGIEGGIGSAGRDRFHGDGGANLFQGGAGKDTYTLDAGNDLLDFNAVAESGPGSGKRDLVTDFVHLADDIDLVGIDADPTLAGDQPFRWVGTSALGRAPGALGFVHAGADTIVRASNDRDAAAEFEIQLTGRINLTADDFVL